MDDISNDPKYRELVQWVLVREVKDERTIVGSPILGWTQANGWLTQLQDSETEPEVTWRLLSLKEADAWRNGANDFLRSRGFVKLGHAAKLLGVPVAVVRRLVEGGKLPALSSSSSKSPWVKVEDVSAAISRDRDEGKS